MNKFQMFFSILGLGVLIGVLLMTGAILNPWVMGTLIVSILLLVLAVVSPPAFNKLVSVFPAIASGAKNMMTFWKKKEGNDGDSSGNNDQSKPSV